MENKIDKVEIKEEDISEVKDFTEEELADESADWKVKAGETLGTAKRRTTQLKKAKSYIQNLEKELEEAKKTPPPSPQNKVNSQSDEFDYGQLAFHNSRPDSTKILDEDVEFLKEEIKATGKPQSYILKSKYFLEELTKRHEEKTAKDAVPPGTSRANAPAKDSLDYWYKKYEDSGFNPDSLPQDTTMKRKVVNEREAREKGTTSFFA